ncbi:putative polysaccharide biosynthesis protein, WlaX [Helicobacter mustelae 12198]|uniref:Putative polysaccharide biosynthesis protein, WlaX n=2 Tax=Helicobacter mustelae TaxID=217 RepID=D3UJI5_HELM1|nr:putative polysaccharide biosynthesis protein, WlaX [Helicobacter mustelae 12198]
MLVAFSCYNASMICVLDIETIPDVDILRRMYPDAALLSDLDLCAHAFFLQKEKTGSEFLPLHLHKIICISSVLADEYGYFIKVGNFGKGEGEENLLTEFLSFMDKKNPKLVSFNGRNFDIPAILLRSMRYNLSAIAYYETENPKHNKNKWENYRQRYSERFHVDLFDTLGNFGNVRGLQLDKICMMLDLPGKYDISGDMVHHIYYDPTLDEEEKMEQIQTYCQSDVLNTYWVYLKYELLRGAMSKEDYFSILLDFRSKIPQDRSYSSHFLQALDRELARA